MPENDKLALIGALQVVCAYPERAAEFLGRMKKEHPEAVGWLEAELGILYDLAVMEAAARIPRPLAELPVVTWKEVMSVAAGLVETSPEGIK